jgi:hypothetical protein
MWSEVPNASFYYEIIDTQHWLYYKVNDSVILGEGYKADGPNTLNWMRIIGQDMDRKYKLASIKGVLKQLNKRMFIIGILEVRI